MEKDNDKDLLTAVAACNKAEVVVPESSSSRNTQQ